MSRDTVGWIGGPLHPYADDAILSSPQQAFHDLDIHIFSKEGTPQGLLMAAGAVAQGGTCYLRSHGAGAGGFAQGHDKAVRRLLYVCA